jgi:hypothetical protein
MDDTAAKRNAPHINKANEYADQLIAVNSTLVFGEKAEENDFAKTAEMAGAILNQIRSNYNNREMSLVCTKLQEAIQWCEEKNTTMVKYRLTEAKNWCREYARILATD